MACKSRPPLTASMQLPPQSARPVRPVGFRVERRTRPTVMLGALRSIALQHENKRGGCHAVPVAGTALGCCVVLGLLAPTSAQRMRLRPTGGRGPAGRRSPARSASAANGPTSNVSTIANVPPDKRGAKPRLDASVRTRRRANRTGVKSRALRCNTPNTPRHGVNATLATTDRRCA